MVCMDHEICAWETDIHGLIRPSQLLRYGMWMSQKQQDDEGIVTPEIVAQTHLGWMLARFRCEQRATARQGERLRVTCSPRAVQRAYYIREARIERGEEELARVRMVWIPVNMETRHILRVPELEQLFPPNAPRAEIEDLRRLPQPKELPEWGTIRVPYSRCDSNGHYSSAHYVDLVCDAFGFWKGAPQRASSVQIDYHAEFRPEEELVLCGAREGGAVTARGAHADGRTGFVAAFQFDAIED